MNRDSSIDALKAFAIFLVVLGHFLQTTLIDFDNNLLFKFIYSFHMPLFIFLSGYLTYHTDGIKNNFLKLRFLSLIIPYFSWMLVTSTITSIKDNHSLGQIMLNSFLHPDNGLWFLWVLFFMHLLLFCCDFVTKNHILLLISIITIIILLSTFIFKADNTFAIKTFASLLPYYIFGLAVNKFKKRLTFIYNNWFIFLPVFLFLVYFWQRNDALDFNIPIRNSKVFILIYKTIVASLGIIISIGLFSKINKFYNFILYVGKNSLAIYAIHFYSLYALEPIKNILNGTFYYEYAAIISILIISFCLFITYFLNKNKQLAFLFLGKVNKY